MNHRHLLPEEIDQLLDDEEGFGVAPLRAHVEACAECGGRLTDLSRVVSRLEVLSHLSPAPRFADRVMSQVQIFEPWHASLRDSVRQWIPTSSIGRVLVGATGGVMAVVLTIAAVWVGRRADALLFLGNLVMERTRQGLATAAVDMASALLGAGAATAVQNGGTVAIFGAGALFLATVCGAAFGLKAVATAGRRRRS